MLINSEDGDKQVPTSLARKRESGVGSLFVDDRPWPALPICDDNSYVARPAQPSKIV